MKKAFRLLRAWLHWIFGQIMALFFRTLGLVIAAVIIVLASTYVIDYAYQRAESPCLYDRFEYSAFVKLKLYEPGMEKVKLTLVEFELRYEDRIRWFRAWLTPEQVEQVRQKTPLNVMETPGGGHIIANWAVTIEEL